MGCGCGHKTTPNTAEVRTGSLGHRLSSTLSLPAQGLELGEKAQSLDYKNELSSGFALSIFHALAQFLQSLYEGAHVVTHRL